MSLPQRVQEQLQAAEAMEQQEQAAREAAAKAAPTVSLADLTAQPQNPPASEPPAPVAAVPPPVAPKEDFEQKYRTLQGMYSADVKQMRTQIGQLVEQVRSLQTKEPEPPPAPATDPQDIVKFGEDMMEMVQRYVTNAVTAVTARIEALERTVNGVNEKAALTAEQQFYTLLDQLQPDWKQINEDPRWLAWLGVKDDVYGVPRQAALDRAFQQEDARQVAKVFQAFVASLPKTPAQPTLDNQVVPDSAGGTTPPTPTPNKPMLSERAITAFYNDVARGVYVGRQAEQDALEAQINAAVAEGRVRP
jgi:hypothetical protein